MIFHIYTGDLIGLPTNNNHLVYRWNNPDCKILFSAARQGNALSVHLASDKAGLRRLRQAASEWLRFVAMEFPWCEMVFAKTLRKSIERMVCRIGFKLLVKTAKCNVFVYDLRRGEIWDS